MRQLWGLCTNRCSLFTTLPYESSEFIAAAERKGSHTIRIVLSGSERCRSRRTHPKELWEMFRIINEIQDFGVANIKVRLHPQELWVSQLSFAKSHQCSKYAEL